MIRKIKRALGIRFSAKALGRNPALYVRQLSMGFRTFHQLGADLLERRTASIVQVGANDGGGRDPLEFLLSRYRDRVQGALLIEPQPDAFERLKERYRGVDQIVCLNAAIGREVGERQLHTTVDPGGDRIASFDRRHVERSLRRRKPGLAREALDSMVRTLSVPVTTLDLAAESAGMEHPCILVVDTEGYDGEVVGMALDLGWRPKLLQWEHKHLSREDRRRLTRRLEREGYRLSADHADTWGVREGD